VSVHGEYARALRGVRERLSEREGLVGEAWSAAFEAAEATPTRDLSAAARTALALIERLEAELAATAVAPGREAPAPAARRARLEPLRDACHHMRAHCRAILGV